jgi:hypothetical protein
MKTFLLIALVIITLFALQSFVQYLIGYNDTLGLKVESITDGPAVRVTNVGNHPITVKKITVNGRKECTDNFMLRDLSVMMGGWTLPQRLDIGDATGTLSGCAIVRVLVETDRGSETYSFE